MSQFYFMHNKLGVQRKWNNRLRLRQTSVYITIHRKKYTQEESTAQFLRCFTFSTDIQIHALRHSDRHIRHTHIYTKYKEGHIVPFST